MSWTLERGSEGGGDQRARLVRGDGRGEEAVGQSRNARHLLSLPELHEDVAFCVRRDAFDLVAVSDANEVVRRLA